jgi:hypothetical protein
MEQGYVEVKLDLHPAIYPRLHKYPNRYIYTYFGNIPSGYLT